MEYCKSLNGSRKIWRWHPYYQIFFKDPLETREGEGERERTAVETVTFGNPKEPFWSAKIKTKTRTQAKTIGHWNSQKKHTHQTSISSKHTVFICQLSFVSLHNKLLSLAMLPYCYNSPPPSLSPPLVFVFYLCFAVLLYTYLMSFPHQHLQHYIILFFSYPKIPPYSLFLL